MAIVLDGLAREEERIAYILALSYSRNDWNPLEISHAVLNQYGSKLDLKIVVQSLENFFVEAINPRIVEKMFLSLRALYQESFYSSFPLDVLFGKWRNQKTQIMIVYSSLMLSSEILNYSLFPGGKVLEQDDFINLGIQLKSNASLLLSQTWNSLSLIDFCARMIDSEHFEDAKPIYEMACRQCPEILCIGLAMLRPGWNSVNKEVLIKLLCGFLLGQGMSSVVLAKLWTVDEDTMLVCMVELHRRDPSCLSRLLDVAQELKILPNLLSSKSLSFNLDCAVLAYRRQHLNLDKWFRDQVTVQGQPFIEASYSFVMEKLGLQIKRQKGQQTPPFVSLPYDSLMVILKVFQHNSTISPGQLKELSESIAIAYEASSTSAPAMSVQAHHQTEAPVSSDQAAGHVSFSADVEDDVNSFFDKVFTRQCSVPDAVEILKRLKQSDNPREQAIFSCFIHNLCDEYRFFAKYPENELMMTAVLYGQLISHNLFPNQVMGNCLKAVLEALKKPPVNKLFKFGITSLFQFQNRLAEWPHFCGLLLQVSTLRELYPDFYNYIASCGGSSPIGTATISSGQSMPTMIKSTPMETPSAAPLPGGERTRDPQQPMADFPAPPDSLRDKILFIINNLSASNIPSKANELVKVLNEIYFEWLAQYVVVKRASTEPNFHELYVKLLDCLQLSKLEREILSQTYSFLNQVFHSAPASGVMNYEKIAVKNIGTWLGMLTLGRNKPILKRDLCLKELLMESFRNNKLLLAIPFVCKVLEQASQSRVFSLPNPWLLGHLRLLAEFYAFGDLKLNMKFEIELLFKSHRTQIKSIEPSSHFSFSRKAVLAPSEPFESVVERFIVPIYNIFCLNERVGPLLADDFSRVVFLLATYYAIGESLVLLSEKCMKMAQVSSLALISKDTRSLGLADASKSVKGVLSGYLACMLIRSAGNDVVRAKITANLFTIASFFPVRLPEATISMFCEETSKSAILLMERVVLESAIGKDHLRALSEMHNMPSIYEEVQKMVTVIFSAPLLDLGLFSEKSLDQSLAALRPSLSKGDSRSGNVASTSPTAEVPVDLYFQSTCSRFLEIVAMIEKTVVSVSCNQVAKLPPGHDLRNLMKQIIVLASASPVHRDELCLIMSQRLMQGLYKTDSKLYVDIVILLLMKIFEFSTKAAKEVTSWVVYSTDDRKYNVLATAALLSCGLIYVIDFDAELAKHVESGRDVAISFAIHLVRRCVFEEPAISAPYDFVQTLEALNMKRSVESPHKADIERLLSEISAVVRAPASSGVGDKDSSYNIFTEWLRLFQHPSLSEKLTTGFVFQLFERNLISSEAELKGLVQTCFEMAIEVYARQRKTPSVIAYRGIDAFSGLFINIMKHHPGGSDRLSRLAIFRSILSVFGIVLVQSAEQKIGFLQRPIARALLSIFSGCISVAQAHEREELISSAFQFLLAINPILLPFFSMAWFGILCSADLMILAFEVSSAKIEHQLGFTLCVALRSLDVLLVNCPEEASMYALGCLTRALHAISQDCPAFLSQFASSFALFIPPLAHQLSNIILSATPSSVSASSWTKLSSEVNGSALKASDEATKLLNTRMMSEVAFHCGSGVGEVLSQAKESPLSSSSSLADRLLFLAASAENVYQQTYHGEAVETSQLCSLLSKTFADANPADRLNLAHILLSYLSAPSIRTFVMGQVLMHIYTNIPDSRELFCRCIIERLDSDGQVPWGLSQVASRLMEHAAIKFWEQPFMTPPVVKYIRSIKALKQS